MIDPEELVRCCQELVGYLEEVNGAAAIQREIQLVAGAGHCALHVQVAHGGRAPE